MNAPHLKIGIACFPLVGGSGILASALGMELAERGHDVHFFSYSKPVRLDLSAPRIYFHEVAVGQHSVFPCPDYTLPLAVKMSDVAQAAGLEILHAHYAVPHATAAFLAAQMVGRSAPKIVTTLHGTDTTMLGANPQYRPAIAHALHHSDAVTTVSESLRKQTIETFQLANENVEVIPNFFTPASPTRSREETRRELGLKDDEFLALHMSNLRPTKRIDLLLRVIAQAKHRQRIRLLILAGAPFEPYDALLDELGVRDRVIIRTEPDQIENYLQAADAALSTSEVESFGLSILEAMFFAKPVLAFAIGGIPEVLEQTGMLFSLGDVSSMSAALDQLVDSPRRAREIGEKGRARALENFTADKIVPRYESLYQRTLSSAAKP